HELPLVHFERHVVDSGDGLAGRRPSGLDQVVDGQLGRAPFPFAHQRHRAFRRVGHHRNRNFSAISICTTLPSWITKTTVPYWILRTMSATFAKTKRSSSVRSASRCWTLESGGTCSSATFGY